VVSITRNAAVSGGSVTNAGNGTISAYGVCYSSNSNPPTLFNSVTVDGSGTNSFISNLTGLNDSTVYYACAYATNESGTSYGVTIRFTTLGFSIREASSTTGNLFGICFADANHGWAVGNGNIIATSNGGTTWTQQTNPVSTQLNDVCFTNINNGYAVGYNGTVLTTTNGYTWTPQSPTANNLFGVCSTSAAVYAVGSNGTILTTPISSSSWTTQTSNTTNQLNDICFTDANHGWVVGSGGTILTTTISGTWSLQTVTTNNLYGVYFFNSTKGWAVGDNGTILTTNDGNTWTAQTSGTTNSLRSIYFINSTNGYAVGSEGIILTTNDGGTTWVAQTNGTTKDLHSLGYTSQTVYAAGNGGAILQLQ
jgi:photosystem II stability/assembly factor-like uncharacterized protein